MKRWKKKCEGEGEKQEGENTAIQAGRKVLSIFKWALLGFVIAIAKKREIQDFTEVWIPGWAGVNLG